VVCTKYKDVWDADSIKELLAQSPLALQYLPTQLYTRDSECFNAALNPSSMQRFVANNGESDHVLLR